MKPRGTLTLSHHVECKRLDYYRFFHIWIKVELIVMCVWIFFLPELSLVSWKAATKQILVWEEPSPLQLELKLKEWCKRGASSKPVSLQGGHLGEVCQPHGKRQELGPTGGEAASCGSGSGPVPAPGKSGRLLGWAAGSGITLHRCVNSSSAQHLCPPPFLPSLLFLAPRQDSQMLAKLWRTARSSPLSLMSDQNNHRWLGIGGRRVCRLFKAQMRHLCNSQNASRSALTTGEEIKTQRGVRANCITEHQRTHHPSFSSSLSLSLWFDSFLLQQVRETSTID